MLYTFAKNTLAGNVVSSISDHLTQFLITTNENKSLPEKEQIDIQTYRNYTKDKFLMDLKQINWNNYLKINQNDPHHPWNHFSENLTSSLIYKRHMKRHQEPHKHKKI